MIFAVSWRLSFGLGLDLDSNLNILTVACECLSWTSLGFSKRGLNDSFKIQYDLGMQVLEISLTLKRFISIEL